MAGLEFISPPLPLAEMVSDLQKVVKWAQRMGCETNESTGLHMNVSIPNYSLDKLDYVKMALFLGDEWILSQFGREGNTYCKSALSTIKQKAANNPDLALRAFEKLGEHMNLMASKLVHSGNTDKYTSINTKDHYIEVRSPGGDWLNEDLGKLTSTLYRIVIALDAACDEQKYRQEYMTKFYKLMSPMGDNVMQLFSQFKSGELTPEAFKVAWAEHVLKSPTVSTMNGPKPVNKAAMDKANHIRQTVEAKSWWKVDLINPNNQEITRSNEVVAKTAEEAILHTRTSWALPGARYPNTMFVTTRLKPFVDPHKEKAQNIANSDEFAQVTGTQQNTIHDDNWEVYDASTGESKFQFYAIDGVAAVERQHMSAYADDRQFRVRPIDRSQSQGQGQGQWGRWFVDFQDHTQASVSARNEHEAVSAGYQLGRGPIVSVTREGGETRSQTQRWRIQFSDGATMTVDAINHHNAEQEAIRRSNYSQNEIDSIVLET
jgi:hypothetical protein